MREKSSLSVALFLLLSGAISLPLAAAESKSAAETPTDAPANSNVKYKASKAVNFEELLIQGQLRRQEIAVVTGDTPAGTDGLVKLRENFLDRIADDFSEEMP